MEALTHQIQRQTLTSCPILRCAPFSFANRSRKSTPHGNSWHKPDSSQLLPVAEVYLKGRRADVTKGFVVLCKACEAAELCATVAVS
mmetsp:Transcript_14015/g.30695  ORF Transcript_14015/g.30695 Transcript_14015/m.30695 type:complete len:87 (+) Transcript_14015:43-303(+)